MSELSFEIKNSSDFLKKLREDYEEYKKDYTSSRVAINCAMTAWHLTDWVYYEFMEAKHSKLSNFQNELKILCPELQIMHDITNSTKHHTLKQHKSLTEGTGLHDGDFNEDFSDEDFDIPCLEIVKKDGTILFFDIELKKVINFWNSYFAQNIELSPNK